MNVKFAYRPMGATLSAGMTTTHDFLLESFVRLSSAAFLDHTTFFRWLASLDQQTQSGIRPRPDASLRTRRTMEVPTHGSFPARTSMNGLP